MRCRLVFMVLWLWCAIHSQEDEVTPSTPLDCTKRLLDHEEKQLQPNNTHMIRINCEDKKNVEVHYDHSNCMISYGNEHNIIDWEKYKATIIECECNECTSEPGTTSEVKQQFNSGNNSTTVVVLGASVGLLLVLLMVVITGWVWCWWSMRERWMNSDQARSDNIIESQINPCYNQPTLPVYESIPSHPKQDNKREGGKQREDSYDILNREQLGIVMDPEMIHKEAKMFNYSKLELADNKIKPEKNPAYATTTQSDV